MTRTLVLCRGSCLPGWPRARSSNSEPSSGRARRPVGFGFGRCLSLARLPEPEKLCAVAASRRTSSRRQKPDPRRLNLTMADEINAEDLARLRGNLHAEVRFVKHALSQEETAQSQTGDAAVQAFELSQSLVARWDRADAATKRLILETVCLNQTLTGVTLHITARSPFDLLLEEAEERNGRSERI